ncbi:MAG: CheR family methyltransferase, partial [Planctomycetota bacterium]
MMPRVDSSSLIRRHTLAVLLSEHASVDALRKTKILATDISREALSTAKAGIYGAARLGPLGQLREKY